MLARRIQRDIVERGRDVKGILDQLVPPPPFTFMGNTDFIFLSALYRYLRYVKPSYDNFVYPTAAHADIVCSSPPSFPRNRKIGLIFIFGKHLFFLDCARFEQLGGY